MGKVRIQIANIEEEIVMDIEQEKRRQQLLLWDRSSDYSDYKSILALFQAQSVLENAQKDSLLDLACGDGTILLCYPLSSRG